MTPDEFPYEMSVVEGCAPAKIFHEFQQREMAAAYANGVAQCAAGIHEERSAKSVVVVIEDV